MADTKKSKKSKDLKFDVSINIDIKDIKAPCTILFVDQSPDKNIFPIMVNYRDIDKNIIINSVIKFANKLLNETSITEPSITESNKIYNLLELSVLDDLTKIYKIIYSVTVKPVEDFSSRTIN